MAICPSSFERLMRRPADVGAMIDQQHVFHLRLLFCHISDVSSVTTMTDRDGGM
jgi:hypothetical protein